MASTETLAFDLVSTLDDQIAFNIHLGRQKQIRRRTLTTFTILFVFFAVLGFATSYDWTTPAPSAGDIADAFADRDTQAGLITALLPLAIFVLIAVILGLLKPARVRIAVKRVLLERPDIDKTDPLLRQYNHCVFGPEGYTWSTTDSTVRVSWASVIRLDETPTHLFLMTGLMSGFVFPKQAMGPDITQQMKDIVALYRPAAIAA